MRFDTNPHYQQQYRNETNERHKKSAGCTAYTRTCVKCKQHKNMSKGCKSKPFICTECVKGEQ